MKTYIAFAAVVVLSMTLSPRVHAQDDAAGVQDDVTSSADIPDPDANEIKIDSATPVPSAHLDQALIEKELLALRSADREVVLRTLRDLSTLDGYPKVAEPLLPALLWIKEGADEELAEEASVQAGALGWPVKYCLSCLRQFAARQDNVYKIMGIKALGEIAWHDPEAMLALLEIAKEAHNPDPVYGMVRATAAALEHIGCPLPDDMERWNQAALPWMGRMQAAFTTTRHSLRDLAQVLVDCPDVRDDLKRAAQDYLDSLPPSLNGVPTVKPTPEAHWDLDIRP